MRAKLWLAILAFAILTVFTALPLAGAEKTVQEKGRQVYHFVKAETMQVGDVPGHVIGVVEARGVDLSRYRRGGHFIVEGHDRPDQRNGHHSVICGVYL